eukprot:GHVU01159419.1.p1 GENE.GHVU01159419.1~~GHVU01159419.1.p1  ORF type:complete len:194 (+),score=10.99 GHVU01159419.1:40-621(+)
MSCCGTTTAAGVVTCNPATIQPGGYEPRWANVPPHVPTYPNPPAYFRKTPPELYTAPMSASGGYQKWWDKWHWQHPEWKEEHYRSDPMSPVMRKQAFQSGTMRPAYTASWNKPRPDYHRQGLPETEATRARGLNRTHWAIKNKNVYQFSNAMTSTQYKKPVTSVYGPLLREKVYGVNSQHSKHGFMGFNDYYF